MTWLLDKTRARSATPNRLIASFAALLSGNLIAASPVVAQGWPRLREASSEQVCTKSLGLAEAAFNSKIPVIYATNTAPKALNLKVVVGPQARDISGGHSLVVDAEAFVEVPAPTGRRRSLYWQRQPDQGLRFAVAEYSFSWQGDWFELFAVPKKMTPAELQAQVDLQDDDRSIQALELHSWRPPLLVQDENTKEISAIYVGEPYDFLADWRVYAIGPDGAKQRCVIQFKPDIAPADQIGQAWDLLPTETRELAKLLNGTLGNAKYYADAGIKIEAQHAWSNAAMRPWLYDGADTSQARERARVALKRWSLKTRSFARHYAKMQKQYPLAEAALADHYRNMFGMTQSKAVATAQAAIDTAYAVSLGLLRVDDGFRQ